MHEFIEDLGKTRTLPRFFLSPPYSYELYRAPSLLILVQYLIKTIAHFGRKLFRRLGQRYYRWAIAYQLAERWQSSVLWKSNTIANPPQRFLADPVVFRRANLRVCFAEDYHFTTKEGRFQFSR